MRYIAKIVDENEETTAAGLEIKWCDTDELKSKFDFKSVYPDSNQVKLDLSQLSKESLLLLGEKIAQLFYGEPYQPTEKQIRKYQEEAQGITEREQQILEYSQHPKKRKEILEDLLEISNQTKNFKSNVLSLVDKEMLQLTIKDKPNSQHQKYLITPKGKVVLYLSQEHE